jgi:hypothetical protein
MLRHIIEGTRSHDVRLAEMIAGFDLVNEEDFTEDIATFAESITKAQ